MLVVIAFAVLLVVGALLNAHGNPITGLGLFVGGFLMLAVAHVADGLRRGTTGLAWVGGAWLVVGFGIGAMSPDYRDHVWELQIVGVTATVLCGAAVYGALADRADGLWVRPAAIGTCGAAALAWLAAWSEVGSPHWASVLTGVLLGALVVVLFLHRQASAAGGDDDVVWAATSVLVLLFAVFSKTGGLRTTTGGYTPSPKPGTFRKL